MTQAHLDYIDSIFGKQAVTDRFGDNVFNTQGLASILDEDIEGGAVVYNTEHQGQVTKDGVERYQVTTSCVAGNIKGANNSNQTIIQAMRESGFRLQSSETDRDHESEKAVVTSTFTANLS